jgi:hypothetical protein
LDVDENGNANFLLEHLAQGEGDAAGDTTRPDRGNRLARGIGSGHFDTFGNDDQAEAFAAKFTGANRVADGFEFKGTFRDQDDVRAPTNTGVKSDPAGVATYDFDQHDAMMTFGRGVKTINSFSGDDQGGVKAKSDFGRPC